MKFGGTSVADAEGFRRAAEIVAPSAGGVVVVVSAACGVTNRLVEAARRAGAGEGHATAAITDALVAQHLDIARALVGDAGALSELAADIKRILGDVACLCRGTALLRELTPRALDAISGAGERLSARLLACTLRESGLKAVAVDATELIVTDGEHGRAEPLMDETRERAAEKLRPLLEGGAIPVVTGFIGATADGTPTTLGRNGSDYSATIIGAALGADAVVIWSDVDGILTADPRLVPDASVLGAVSYEEADEMAHFGARVLHPKTLRPLAEACVPVCIRNSFSPDAPGTIISPPRRAAEPGVKAVTGMTGLSLVTVISGDGGGFPGGVAAKALSATAGAQVGVLLISQSSARGDLCFVVESAEAARAEAALRQTFSQEATCGRAERVAVAGEVAVVALVGAGVREMPGVVGRAFGALEGRGINVVAFAHGSSDYSVSLVVEACAIDEAVVILHREFCLQRRAAPPEPALVEGDIDGALAGV